MALITLKLDSAVFPYIDLRKNQRMAWGKHPALFLANRNGGNSVEGEWATAHARGEYWIAFDMEEDDDTAPKNSLLAVLTFPHVILPENAPLPKTKIDLTDAMSPRRMYAVFTPSSDPQAGRLELEIFPGVTAKSACAYGLVYTTEGNAGRMKKGEVKQLYELLRLRAGWSRDVGLVDFERCMYNPLYRCGAYWLASQTTEPDDDAKRLRLAELKGVDILKAWGVIPEGISEEYAEPWQTVGGVRWYPILSFEDINNPLYYLYVRDDLEVVTVTDILYELARVAFDTEARIELTASFYRRLQAALAREQSLAGLRNLLAAIVRTQRDGIAYHIQNVLDGTFNYWSIDT